MKKSTLCYVEKEGSYLMLYRNKKEYDENGGKWVGIGGKIEPSETPEQCLLREVYEETGLTLLKYTFHGIIHFHSDIWEDEDMYLYSSNLYEGKLRFDCPEGELHFVDKNELYDLPMWEGDRYFLDAMIDGQTGIEMNLFYEGDKLVKVQ